MKTCFRNSSPRGQSCAPGLRRVLGVAFLLALAPLAGCGDDDIVDPADELYLPQTSAANVMSNFVVAYARRDPEQYARLLADDFRFYFDPNTRDEIGIASWTRTEDSTATGNLLESPFVSAVKIQLGLDTAVYMLSGQPAPRDSWITTRLSGAQVLLEVDFDPGNGQEVTTFRVSGDPQRFYFRRGRSATPAAGDTLFYLVEWRDEGDAFAAPLRPGGAAPVPLTEATTWSSIKTLIHGLQ